jgi:hypothetical protein
MAEPSASPTRARARIRRVHAHLLADKTTRRPAGILGSAEEPEQRGQALGVSPGRLEAFLPSPAEVRTVEPRGGRFSAQEYREQGFTGPVRLFSAAQVSAVAAAFLSAPPVTSNRDALSQRSARGTQKPPSTHPATWNDTLPMAKHTGLLDLVTEVLGPDLVLWATVFWHKPPRSEGYIPWQCVNHPTEHPERILAPWNSRFARTECIRLSLSLSLSLSQPGRCVLAAHSSDQLHSLDCLDPNHLCFWPALHPPWFAYSVA